ncbi:MAG: hypothetical protein RDV48_19890 [Candidatus Eremiobacteraeota bacterium]|nr:hypothetical protein [Candidatus Eremiobacteraeota bacterium]
MKRNMRRGATLMECLVSIFIICIAVFSVMKIIPVTGRAATQTDNRINAAYYAKSVIDDVRKAGFAKAAATSGTFVYSGLNDGKPFTQSFSYKADISLQDTDKKLITVTMTWTESGGGKRLVLQTIMVDTSK